MQLLNHEPGFFIWEVIAFLIFLVLLKRVAWKPVLKYFKERQADIQYSLANVERVKDEMEALKNEHEKLMVKIHEERSLQLIEAKEISEKIMSEAKKEAQVQSEIIIAEASTYMSRLKNDAVKEITKKTGDLVLELAEKVLRKELSGTIEQESHISRMIENLKLEGEVN